MKIVLCHGVWDLLHPGHVHHLEQAKKLGDVLMVSVVADAFITKRTPIYTQEERVGMLKALRVVDDVILCEAPGPEEIIEGLLPDLYVRGEDYMGKRMPESALLERLGIPVRCIPSIQPRASSVIERVLDSYGN